MGLTIIFTIQGYFQRHFELCQTCTSQKEAYYQLEDELEALQKELKMKPKPRYTSYESFRMSKTRYYKENR
jgi:hypothetical protein